MKSIDNLRDMLFSHASVIFAAPSTIQSIRRFNGR